MFLNYWLQKKSLRVYHFHHLFDTSLFELDAIKSAAYQRDG